MSYAYAVRPRPDTKKPLPAGAPACLGLLLALLLALVTEPAAAAKVVVRGRVSIEADARVAGVPPSVEVRGRLVDDAGHAVAGQPVRIRWRESPEGPLRRLPTSETCAPTRQFRSALADEDVVVTDPAGHFCVRFKEATPDGLIEIKYAGDPVYSDSTENVEVDSKRRTLSLHFSPEPSRLSLDRAVHPIWIETRLEPPVSATEEVGAVQLVLTFAAEGHAPVELGHAAVRPGERAQIEIESQKLGEPGPGTLSVMFAGSDSIQAAERKAVVERTAHVTLSLAGPIARSDPHDGLEIRVAVGSALGAVPNGTVEARVFGESVGAAPVSAGAAHVLAIFDAPHGGQTDLTLHYLPAAPWWEPALPLAVTARVAPPNPLRRLPWLFGALLVAAWIVRGWRRPARTDKAPDDEKSAPPGRPLLDVVEVGPAHSGWRGRVLDAHDGTPIAGARVSVLVPAFGGSGIAASADTDKAGQFELPDVSSANVEGARMEAKARWHATLTRPVPPAGSVAINLVTRRRALLERLVQWATRQGVPWKTEGDPTPQQVARTARRRQANDVAHWADAVERAAFGPEPPDEAAEHKVRGREPRWE